MGPSARLAAILPLGALLSGYGCGHAPHDVCARPALFDATPTRGDTNADGRADITDGVLLARRELSGGPDPACGPCLDIQEKGRFGDVGQAAALWYYLFSGTMGVLPEVPAGTTLTDPGPPPECGAADLAFEAISDTSVAVTLETDGIAAEAWSYGITADGCTISAITTAGTDGADVLDGGLRTRGFDRTDAQGGTATSAVVLSWRDAVALPADGPRRIALLTIELGSSCCNLSFTDGVVGRGQPVALTVTAGGWSFVPHTHDLGGIACRE